MCFDGEIVFGISNSAYVDVDFGKDILPTKVKVLMYCKIMYMIYNKS